jgi:hypothetical protein
VIPRTDPAKASGKSCRIAQGGEVDLQFHVFRRHAAMECAPPMTDHSPARTIQQHPTVGLFFNRSG